MFNVVHQTTNVRECTYSNRNLKNNNITESESFVDFDICHRMVSSRKLYFVTLTYFYKVEKEEFNIAETLRASAKMNGSLLWILAFAIAWCHCENCSP